ncbi:MAG: flagellar biosynthesis protein FliQ [Planctomycetaceae bacterium]|nr:flagellar biosynthesis protein FliQ [Planctomycetaceae bacterium]
MEMHEVLSVGREVLLTAVLLSAPAIGISLLVGVMISVFQAATSIQEQTLSFAPRIVAVALTLVLTLPWSLRLLSAFTLRMFGRLLEVAT